MVLSTNRLREIPSCLITSLGIYISHTLVRVFRTVVANFVGESDAKRLTLDGG